MDNFKFEPGHLVEYNPPIQVFNPKVERIVLIIGIVYATESDLKFDGISDYYRIIDLHTGDISQMAADHLDRNYRLVIR